MSTIPTLHTERLTLCALTNDDAPDVARFAGSPEVQKTTLNIPFPYSEQDAIEWISGHEAAAASGENLHWLIVERQSGQVVGTIDLRVRIPHKRAEMGYWIGPPFWGQGYATEAVRAVIRHGFTALDLNRVFADHFTRNPASGRVMAKAGMKLEGTLRNQYMKGDEVIDSHLYAITRNDFEDTLGA